MSEKNLKINEIRIANEENTRLIKLAETNAGMSGANILNYRKRLKQLIIECKLRAKEMKDRLKRALDNTKRYHDTIDELIENKEILHEQLKAAYHFGETQCKWCKRYYTPEGINRHKRTCSMKPKRKVVNKNKKQIDEHKKKQAARKKSLEREVIKKNVKKRI